jgi:hypothetical protein
MRRNSTWRKVARPVAAWQRELLAGGAGLMAAACLVVALWAAILFPPAGWICYLLALGWFLLGGLCLPDQRREG